MVVRIGVPGIVTPNAVGDPSLGAIAPYGGSGGGPSPPPPPPPGDEGVLKMLLPSSVTVTPPAFGTFVEFTDAELTAEGFSGNRVAIEAMLKTEVFVGTPTETRVRCFGALSTSSWISCAYVPGSPPTTSANVVGTAARATARHDLSGFDTTGAFQNIVHMRGELLISPSGSGSLLIEGSADTAQIRLVAGSWVRLQLPS